MGITQSYLSILEDSLNKKIEILDTIAELNNEQNAILDKPKFDEEAFNAIYVKKAEQIDLLNKTDEGFQTIYDKVKAELDTDRNQYADIIKSLQQKITEIMEKSSHLMAEEQRNKDRIKNGFASRRREVSSIKKNQQYAANYYKTMNKVTSEPVFMDKKK